MKKETAEKAICAATGLLAGVIIIIAVFTALFGGVSGLRTALKLGTVIRVINAEYVADYDAETMKDSVLSGAVAGIGDRWSYYMNAEEYASYMDYSANRYQGIGVTIQKDEETGGFLIVTVKKDGPAMNAGILADDIILAVDGISVTEGDVSDVKELIQGDYGKDAVLTILHPDGTTEEFSVSCEVIYTSPVRCELLEGGMGYIAIDNFREGAANEAEAALDALLAQGAESIIFDVRNNPGGQLTELVPLLDYLLPEGDLFIRSDREGNEKIERSDENCVEIPMAVVVNGDSYSAAEFFAAALSEYEWAVVVGEPTTGKARSQITIKLADGSAVHLSKYSYLTPLRRDLYEAGGIVPDVELALSEEERQELDSGWLLPEDDPQIQAAIDALTS